MVDIKEFFLLFDEFATVNKKKVQAWLDLAAGLMSESVWGDCYENGVYFLTAHFIASGGGEGGSGGAVGGPITGESVGSLSRSYGTVSVNANGNDELYVTTRYGQMFLNLRRSCVVSACVTNGSTPGANHGVL